MYLDAATARLTRAADSPRQLQEVMVDFWFNHFNVSIDKGLDHIWVGAYEETAIRPNSLGRFRDLLGATAHHAAMLFYLDNWQNTKASTAEGQAFGQGPAFGRGPGQGPGQGPGFGRGPGQGFAQGPGGSGQRLRQAQARAKGRFKGINENYARELMELHTLGVDGGYTQKDVQELARVLTGLGLPAGAGGGFANRNQAQRRRAMLEQARGRAGAGQGQFGAGQGRFGAGQGRFGAGQGRFGNRQRQPGVRNYGMPITADMIPGDPKFGCYFDESRHDFGTKVLLGHTIQGKGEQEIEEVLDLLARHPSTARHISYKLAQYFVADEPPESLVKKLATRFTQTDGQIAAVLDTLFHSDEFWDTRYRNAKFKSPYRYLVSTMRATDAQIGNVMPLLGFLKQTGMPLYKCLTPDGYKNTEVAWLNQDNLINRLNFATAVGAGRFPGIRLSQSSADDAAQTVGPMSDRTLSAIEKAPHQLRLALLLGSPEFMKY